MRESSIGNIMYRRAAASNACIPDRVVPGRLARGLNDSDRYPMASGSFYRRLVSPRCCRVVGTPERPEAELIRPTAAERASDAIERVVEHTCLRRRYRRAQLTAAVDARTASMETAPRRDATTVYDVLLHRAVGADNTRAVCPTFCILKRHQCFGAEICHMVEVNTRVPDGLVGTSTMQLEATERRRELYV